MIDLYCERCGPGLLAEPLNALSNLSFLVAAFFAWRLARRLKVITPGIALLITLAISVGIGSALFHTFATPWAQVLDLLPIVLFQLLFLGAYLRRCVGLSTITSSVFVVIYLGVCLLMMVLPPYLNGSIIYVPTFLVLIGLAGFHLRTRQPGAGCSRSRHWSSAPR